MDVPNEILKLLNLIQVTKPKEIKNMKSHISTEEIKTENNNFHPTKNFRVR